MGKYVKRIMDDRPKYQILTKRIKVKPTPDQVPVLWTISEYCRQAWNLAHKERDEFYRNGLDTPSVFDQQEMITRHKENNKNWYIVPSQTYQAVIGMLDGGYRSFFGLRKSGDEKARPPGYKSWKYFTTIPYSHSGYKVENGILKLSYDSKDLLKSKHNIDKVPLEFKVGKEFDDLDISTIHVSNDDPYKARGDFYVSISYKVKDVKPYEDNGKYQAIDPGITKQTAINSDGGVFELKTKRYDKYWDGKINAAKSRRDHCLGGKPKQRKSKKYLRINKAIKVMYRKKSNQLKDFWHKKSTKWADNVEANTVFIGDMGAGLKKMAARKKPKPKPGKKQMSKKVQTGMNRSNQGLGIAKFLQFLTYKLELRGKKAIEIDESYTTQACCVCGKLQDMQPKDRQYVCDCGNDIDRDQNSAINIMLRGLSLNVSMDRLTRIQEFLCNVRNTGHINDGQYESIFLRYVHSLSKTDSTKKTSGRNHSVFS